MIIAVIAAVVALFAGLAIGYVIYYYLPRARLHSAEDRAEKVLLEAEAKGKEILLVAKDEALSIRAEGEAENKERRAEAQRQDRRLQQKEESLDRRSESLERRERNLTTKEQDLDEAKDKLEVLKAEQARVLEQIASLPREEARQLLMAQVEGEVKSDIERRVRDLESEAKLESERRAHKIIGLAIQRCAADVVAETTVSVVNLPNEEMKGRIIGREGRNIRALEAATGIDLIIDDTPEAVILSGFDPVRREVARVALTKLIADGRIHPARIEEVVAKARQEVDVAIREAGERAAFDAGVHSLHPDLVKLMGRMKYRTSYGQNVLNHSIEVSILCAAMAAEVGADVYVCKEAGLLHDIGKAVDHEIEGPHALIGADICKRLGKSAKIVHAIAAHHSDEEPQTVEAFIVAAGDAISAARPGARRETVSTYIKRLEALEEIANSFPGVERSFAIQAGRELRIAVKPEEVDDLCSIRVARDVAKRIEENLDYPGQIKVMVIREKRVVEIAR
ncbi:MAG: binding metal dependent phosphohydrolase [Chloroflexi bacterium]|nr:binding metal dependent phosphohydrolase [Chloroflexota bacterium]